MRRSKNNTIAALLLLGLVGGVLVGAYVVTTPDALRVPEELRRPRRGPRQQIAQPRELYALSPNLEEGRTLTFKKSVTRAPKGVDPAVHVVNEYLRATKITDPQARCLGVDLRDGIAHLNFNPAFLETQGSDDESILVSGILATMAQFPEVKKVLFEVEGKAIDSLGHIDLSTPQDVRADTAPTLAQAP